MKRLLISITLVVFTILILLTITSLDILTLWKNIIAIIAGIVIGVIISFLED